MSQIAAAFIVLTNLRRRRVKEKKSTKNLGPSLDCEKNEQGAYNQLMAELRSGDPDFYKNFLRMSATDFDHLLELISTKIRKKDTWMRKSITPGERLAVTLRYLATGCNGRISDGGVFGNCTLSSALESNTLNIPEPRPLKGRKKLTPFVVVADDAFPLKPHLMKPFPFKQEDMQVATSVFNYLLSRARRVVENAFGLIAQRFRVLRRPVELTHPSRIISVVKAICVLHNYLLVHKDSMRLYAPPGYLNEVDGAQIIEGKWRSDGMPIDNFFPLNNDPSSRPTTNQAKDVRSEFTDYFQTVDGMKCEKNKPWQTMLGKFIITVNQISKYLYFHHVRAYWCPTKNGFRKVIHPGSIHESSDGWEKC
nr:unnamed protein product [Callosobruchus analis]